jgi:hypothetical protein
VNRSFVLALVLCTSTVWANPPTRMGFADVDVHFTIPADFEQRPAANPAPELMGTWALRGEPAPIVLQFVRMNAELPQRSLTETELAAFRTSDITTFTDTPSFVYAMNFRLEALVGSGTVAGVSMVRFASVVPLVGDSVLVVVVGPSARRTQIDELFRQVLMSTEATPGWKTLSQRNNERLRVRAGSTALVLMALYGITAVVIFRRRDIWRHARAVISAAIAVAWSIVGSLAPEGKWYVVVWSVVLALVFAQHAYKLLRRLTKLKALVCASHHYSDTVLLLFSRTISILVTLRLSPSRTMNRRPSHNTTPPTSGTFPERAARNPPSDA